MNQVIGNMLTLFFKGPRNNRDYFYNQENGFKE